MTCHITPWKKPWLTLALAVVATFGSDAVDAAATVNQMQAQLNGRSVQVQTPNQGTLPAGNCPIRKTPS